MNSIAIDPLRIRDRAYALWQQRGCPAGSPEQDWLEAEQVLLAEVQAPTVVAVAPGAGKETVKRVKPPRPTLKRAPNARAARLLNEVAPKAPPQTRAQKAIAAAVAAEVRVKRSAVGTG